MLQLKPSMDKEKDPMAGIMDLMKVVTVYPEVYILSYWAPLE